MQMKKHCLAILFLSFAILTGCSSTSKKAFTPDEESAKVINTPKEKILTEFMNAINNEQYAYALSILIKEDRYKLLESQRTISENLKLRLKSLELESLINNNGINLRNEKITGLPENLPKFIEPAKD